MDSSAQSAVDAALTHDWKQAIKINLLLLKANPKDIDSLNRLARAYFETGLKTKSENTYKKVLRIDKFNPIACKNLELLKSSTIDRSHKAKIISAPAPAFLEEPGITKTISLTRLGNPKIVSRLHPGDQVFIVAHEHCVSALSSAQEYLGRLSDDLASRMRIFLKAGNIYQSWVKSVEPQSGQPSLKIFIKEIRRAAKFQHVPSFPVTEKLSYAAFTPPELIHEEKPNIATPEEDQAETFPPSSADDSSEPPEPATDDN